MRLRKTFPVIISLLQCYEVVGTQLEASGTLQDNLLVIQSTTAQDGILLLPPISVIGIVQTTTTPKAGEQAVMTVTQYAFTHSTIIPDTTITSKVTIILGGAVAQTATTTSSLSNWAGALATAVPDVFSTSKSSPTTQDSASATAASNSLNSSSQGGTSTTVSTTAVSAGPSRTVIIIATVAGILSTFLLSGLAFVYFRRRSIARKSASDYDDHMICRGPSSDRESCDSLQQKGAVYGGIIEKVARSGRVFKIRRLFQRESQAFSSSAAPGNIAANGHVVSKPLQNVKQPAPHMSRFSRFSQQLNRLPDSLKLRRRDLYSIAESSTYNTKDMEVPFYMGSPIRSSPYLADATATNSYSVPDWRTHAYGFATTESSLPIKEVNGANSESDEAAVDSRFSDFNSPTSRTTTRASSFGPVTRPLPPTPLPPRAYNFSKPTTPHINVLAPNAYRPDAMRSVFVPPSDEQNDNVVRGKNEGRRTMVYRLLKLALGK